MTKEAYARRARVALGGGGRGGGGGVVVTLIVADDETSSLREVCGDREVETMPVDVPRRSRAGLVPTRERPRRVSSFCRSH